jgi:hypothetical protein
VHRGLSIAFIVLGVASGARGQGRNGSWPTAIVLGPSVHISADNPTAPHAESFLALNPKEPSQLIASAIVAGHEYGAAVYVSRDGGSSWQRAITSGDGVPSLSGGDPIVYYDLNGAALFSSLCEEPSCSLRVWRSSDGGSRWDSATSVPGRGYDREYLAVDLSSGPYRGRIYAAGTNWVRQTSGRGYPVLGITSSADGARSFLPATVIDVTSDGKSHGFGGIADMLITSRGALVVPIQSSPDLIPSPKRQFYTMISENGGRTFSAPKPGLPIEVGPRGFRRLRADGNIRAAIDESSGAFRDRIYVTYIEYENDRYVVKVTHSDDLGASWSRAVTVNDASGPDDSSNEAIAVNREGVVSLVWNDRRDDAKGECYRLYVSASLDGGDTFLPNVQVNAHATCPNSRGNWSGSANTFTPDSSSVALSGMPSRFSNGGETQGLAADPDGRFHVAWINGESGVMQLWYTSFTVQGEVQTAGARHGEQNRESSSPTSAGTRDSESKAGGAGRTDRTSEVSLQVSAPVLDFDGKTFGFTVSLKNQTSTVIAGPLIVVLGDFESDFGGVTAANSDNGQTGKGAEWRFVVNGQLAPGGVSEARSIEWHFDGKVPVLTKLDAFLANFRIFTEGH